MSKRYQVAATWPMVQIQSRVPHSDGSAMTGRLETTPRMFYAGDVLPTWVDQAEIDRLLDLQAVAEVTE
jgi:hypothetical protein